MTLSNDLKLYAVTDRTWLDGRSLASCVDALIQGGVTMVQLREKKLAQDRFIHEAMVIKKVCAHYHVPFLIDDSLAVALAVDADGIHVGQSDLPATVIREQLGRDKIVGVSVQTLKQAQDAQKAGADYLGVGAVFATQTKTDAVAVPLPELKRITAAVNIPVVANGGIHAANLAQLHGTGIAGIALISALFAANDLTANAQALAQQVATL